MSGNPHQNKGPEPAQFNEEDFSYISKRDVDGDGVNDLVHTIDHDGVAEIHHLDEDGQVVLSEADLDGDGTYETTYNAVGEDDVQIMQDTDNDGEVDMVRFFDSEMKATTQQDIIEDGQVTHTLLDPDGDGITDMELIDTDGDGKFDTVVVDSDKDGYINSIFRDTDGDGEFDEVQMDVDNQDGILETTMTAEDYGDDSLGYVSDFEQFIDYSAGDTTMDDQPES